MTRAELEAILDEHPDVIEFAIHEAPIIHRSNVALRIVPSADSKTVLEELEEEIAHLLPVGLSIGMHVIGRKPRSSA